MSNDLNAAFDRLQAQRQTIEQAFGGQLEWVRNDDRRASWIGVRITVSLKANSIE
jgi:hypothetical protein